MENKEWLKLKEAAAIAGVSRDTIRRWADAGRIKSKRTEGEHRLIHFDSLKKYSHQKNSTKKKYALIYARVFETEQKKELEAQIERLENYCAVKGWNYKVMSHISSGIPYDTKNLNKLLNLILSGSISKLILNYKDSLFLFGSEIIFELCKINNIEVVILSDGNSSLYEQEMKKVIKHIEIQLNENI